MRDLSGKAAPELFSAARVWPAIGLVSGVIFVFDIMTHPQNVSASFAYTIPVFLSILEVRPRPIVYAGATTILSLVGSFTLSADELASWSTLINRAIGVGTQWLAAALVVVEAGRRTALQRSLERQQRFADILAHEVRNALTAVSGHAQRLAKHADKLTPADVLARADKIRAAATRIESVVERVQLASSLGNGIVPVTRTAIDVHALIHRLVDALKEEHPERAFELNLDEASVVVSGDEVLIQQAFENILQNSMHYSSAASPIVVSSARTPLAVKVTIADSGKGVPTDELPRIREAYYRGSTSKSKPGMGLGLYFVDRIIDGHGGSFSLESKTGLGTTATIELPQILEPALT